MKKILPILISIFFVQALIAQDPGFILFETGDSMEQSCLVDFSSINIESQTGAEMCASSYCWFRDVDGTGYENVGGNTVDLLVDDINSAGVYSYKRCYSCFGAPCNETPDSCTNVVVLTIHPTPSAAITPPSQDVCLNGTADLVFTGSEGTPNYTFQYTINGGSPIDISTTGGNNSVTVNHPTNIAGLSTYLLTMVTDANGCTDLIGESATVTVIDPITITNQPESTSVCSGETATLTVTASGISGSFDYQWQESSTDCSSNFTDISGANASTYITPPLTDEAYYRVVVIDPMGNCPNVISDCAIVSIDNSPNPTISYNDPFCTSDGPQQVMYGGSGAVGGATFSSVPAALIIDEITGEITPMGSPPGPYVITYSPPVGTGCPFAPVTTMVTIEQGPNATISYPEDEYCRDNTSTIPVTIVGDMGGTFSSTPTGLSLSSGGNIQPSASQPGTYEVKYTISGSAPCPDFETTTMVTINPAPNTVFGYEEPAFCENDPNNYPPNNPMPASQGGTYTAQAGLAFSPTSGIISPDQSAIGTYEVYYSVPSAGGCMASSDTTIVTIGKVQVADFNYENDAYCETESVAMPQSSNDPGGVWSVSPVGLPIDENDGTITIAGSAPNTYIITYFLEAKDGCSSVEDTDTVIIGSLPVIDLFEYDDPFCVSEATPQLPNLQSNGVGEFSTTSMDIELNEVNGGITPSSSLPGTYDIEYKILARDGCPEAAEMTQVIINALPAIQIDGPNQACQDESVTFSGPNSNVSYLWSTNETTEEIDVSTLTPGMYTYGLEITDLDTECKNSDQKEIEVFDRPEIMSFIVLQFAICDGDSVEIFASTQNDNGENVDATIPASNWIWESDDPNQVTDRGTLTVNTEGFGSSDFNYELIIEDINSCKDTFTNAIYINSLPLTTVEQFPDVVEIGSNFDMEATPMLIEPNSNVESISWTFDPPLLHNCNPAPCEILSDTSEIFLLEDIRATDTLHKVSWMVTDNFGCIYSRMENFTFAQIGCGVEQIFKQDVEVCINSTLTQTYESEIESQVRRVRFILKYPNSSTQVLVDEFENLSSGSQTYDVTFDPSLFTVPGRYEVSVSLEDANDQCSGALQKVHDIFVYEQIELDEMVFSAIQDTICDTLNADIEKTLFVEMANDYLGEQQLTYTVNRNNGGPETKTVSSSDSIFTIVLDNDIPGDYVLEIVKIEHIGPGDIVEICSSVQVESLSYFVLNCQCNEQNFEGDPGTLTIVNDRVCENQEISFTHEGQSSGFEYIYFISDFQYTGNSFQDADLDFSNIVSNGIIEYSSDFNNGQEYYLYAAVREANRDCNILSESEDFIYFDNPEISLDFLDRTYCRNQLVLLEASNNISNGIRNTQVEWSNDAGIPVINKNDTDGVLFIDEDLLGGSGNTTIRMEGVMSHEINVPQGPTCYDTISQNIVVNGIAPDTTSILLWPGNILACNVEDTTMCFEWYVLDNNTGQIEALTSDAQFHFASDDLPPMVGANVNPEITYFVDYYSSDDCESKACRQRIYFTGQKYTFPREEFGEDPPPILYDIGPNPVQNYLNINVHFNEEYIDEVLIFDMHGRILSKNRFLSFKPSIDVSFYPAGTYILGLQTIDGRILHSKFIKI